MCSFEISDSKFHSGHELFTEKAYTSEGMLPDRYVYILTNRCNLSCRFCYQEKKPNPHSLSTNDWITFSRQVPDYARVTLCGGEPLVFNGFREVFSFVAERNECNLITNGVLLGEELMDFLLSFPNFRVLSVSIDDIGNTVRDMTPNQWSKLTRNMKYFLQRRNELGHGAILDVKTVITDENAGGLFSLYRMLSEDIGIDTHALQMLKGSPIQHSDRMYPFEAITKTSKAFQYRNFDTIREQLQKIREYNVENHKASYIHPKVESLTAVSSHVNLNLLNEVSFNHDMFQPCKFPWSSVHINHDGNLFPCLAVSMGNVRELPLPEIICGEKYRKFRELIRNRGTVEACNRCGWLRLKEHS